MIDDQTITKFHDSYTPVTESGCWIWDSPTKLGYGQLFTNGQSISSHRLSWMIHQGPIPDGLFICHKCDIKPCVNPDHLFTGTYYDNMRDAIEKGILFGDKWRAKNAEARATRTKRTLAKKEDVRDTYLLLEEVSDTLGKHIQTVRKWIKQGKLKAYKPTGKKLYVKDDDLRAFIETPE